MISPPPDLLPPVIGGKRRGIRQNRSALRSARAAGGAGRKGARVQPVCANAQDFGEGLRHPRDSHPYAHRRNQGPAGGRQRLLRD